METKLVNADLGNGSYKNPVLYADYSDPDAIRQDDDYFMVASSFCNAPGLEILHSKDLVNWKVINYVIRQVPGARYSRPVHGCGVWAPSIRWHKGLFYVCFPMPDEGIFMSTAEDPFGEWSEPVCIWSGAGRIDPCPLWDDDGRAYLVYGVAGSRAGFNSRLFVSEMSPDGMSLIGEPVMVFDGGAHGQPTIEGPKFYKRGSKYYIFAPAGGVKQGWQTVLCADTPFGEYDYRVVMHQGGSNVNGPHQGAWVDTVTGEDWFLHFQDVYAAGRVVHLQPMHWNGDWPVIGVCTDSEDCGEPVREYRKPNVGGIGPEICEPDASDDFKGKRLGLQWQWNANPGAGWYELAKGAIRLNAVKLSESYDAQGRPAYADYPNLLLQKWPAPEFDCVVRLGLSHLEEGDEAGFISLGTEYAVLVFTRKNSKIKVGLVRGSQHFGKILVESTFEKRTELGIISAEEVSVRCRVRRTGDRYLEAEGVTVPKDTVYIEFDAGDGYAAVCDYTAEPGRWVGVKSGIFCAGSQHTAVSEKLQAGYAECGSVVYSLPADEGMVCEV